MKIRFHRQAKPWSMMELANEAGVSKAYVSDLERRAGLMSSTCSTSLGALGVRLDQLFEGVTPREFPSRSGADGGRTAPGFEELVEELAGSPETALSEDEGDFGPHVLLGDVTPAISLPPPKKEL